MATAAPDISRSGHVIIAGLSHVGYRCAGLLAQLGEPVVVIAREFDEWRLPAGRCCTVCPGDVHDEAVLRRAGIERARALIVAGDDDVANVSICLGARRLNPRLVLVARLFDQALAAHLEQAVPINRVLSTSALAAPAFAAATLGGAVRGSFAVGGTQFRVEERLVGDLHAPVQTVGQYLASATLVVLALQRGTVVTPSPAASTPLLAGDRLVLLGLAPDDSAARAASRGPGRSALPRFMAMALGLREWWREIHFALRLTAVLLLAVTLLSVIVFQSALGLSSVDALYFVVTTITTTGYGDFSLRAASTAMKLYGAFLMLCGAAIVATVFSIFTDLLLRTRLRDVLIHGCVRYRGHIIVAGLGSIGVRLVRELVQHGEAVVAIEQRADGEFVDAARHLVPVVLGHARTVETLRKAGLAGAKAIVAVTDDDLVNLSIGLATKAVHPSCRVVLRIFDSKLADDMHQSLGVNSVLSVSGAAAPTFVGAALCPDVVQGLLLPAGVLLVFARTLLADSADPGRSLPYLGPGESVLLAKRAAAPTYGAVAANDALRAGDGILGLRWCPFVSRQDAP
jgi:Trk K+ transport system NAD-binding subunit